MGLNVMNSLNACVCVLVCGSVSVCIVSAKNLLSNYYLDIKCHFENKLVRLFSHIKDINYKATTVRHSLAVYVSLCMCCGAPMKWNN